MIDRRVTFLMRDMLQEVLRSGTGAGVRGQGFKAPAAGKTGTSRDGWFAGFTSGLLCVVWVGFDDNRELNVEGAHSALPIWADFMKRALTWRQYADARPFTAPDGVVTVIIDPQSGMPATPNCPQRAPEVFIAGTEPVGACTLHGGSREMTVSSWDDTAAGTPGQVTGKPGSTARRSGPAAYQTPAPPGRGKP